jgi:hypothetical protein
MAEVQGLKFSLRKPRLMRGKCAPEKRRRVSPCAALIYVESFMAYYISEPPKSSYAGRDKINLY